ncbi:MAG: TonB-dependent receptor, partial [Pseudomonadota bacterium]
DYKFTDLDDEVLDYSGQVMWPMTTDRSRISITAGGSYSRKVRTYRETTLELVPNAVGNVGLLSRPFGEIFSDENIMGAANDYQLNLNLDTARSYIAATITDGAFGQIDWIWNETWRFAAGARWESYRQVSLPWNLYAFDLVNPAVTTDPAALEQAVFSDDSYYPSVSLTYMTSWWADVFQLRFGWSETVVRPDLREITETSYLDARTDYVTEGCPECVPSDVTNLDLRAEWFFSSGDNLTVTLFHKDLDNPIEFFEFPASDTNRGRLIDNAESGSVSGIEVEALKQLGFLGEFWDAFFLQGNLTLQDSELVVGTLRSNVTPTNSTRKLAGASDYVVNVLLGYDSLDGRHASTLTYNVFGERLFAAGRNPTPDIFEQPFDSLDLTYQWYPTDTITVKAKLQNILDEETVFEQSGIETFVEKPGRSWSVSANWSF